MYENFSEEEKRLLELSDQDNKKIVSAYVEGQEFTKEFIRGLNLEESRRECLDYNEHIRLMKYHEGQIKSFSAYVDIVKGWY